MNKKLIILISAGVIILGLLVFAGVKLYSGISAFSEAEKNLDRHLSGLSKYYNAKPFPSEDNIDTETKNLETLDGWFVTLVQGIRKGQVQDSSERRPSKFIDSFSSTLKKLEKVAANADPEVAMPNEFALGFDRYSKGDLPDPGYVPRLTQQLFIMDNIVNLMIESGVSEIVATKREIIEKTEGRRDATSTSRGSTRGRGRNNVQTQSKKAGFGGEKLDVVNPDAGIFKDGDLFTKFHFIFTMRATEDALVRLLNEIAASPMFIVTTRVSVMKDGPDVIMPAEEEEKATGAGEFGGKKRSDAAALAAILGKKEPKSSDDDFDNEETAEEEPAEPIEPLRLSRKQRAVSGSFFEKPMHVLIELDVYRFADAGGDK